MPGTMSQQEIDAMEERLYDAYNRGAISAQTLAKGLNDAKKGIDGYTAAMTASLKQFGTSLAGLGANMIEGKLGAAQYNNALNAGADAVSNLTAAAGPLGAAFGVLLKVITFGISEVNKMADTLYQANNSLVRAGVAGSDGMTGVFNQMRQFGYGIDQLGDMSKILTENSQALAQFGGDAVTGAKRLAAVSDSMSGLREHFMNMGMSITDINSGIAAYVKQQTVLGRAQNMNQAELREGSKAYLENMSRLSKLTGESADSLAKQLDHANSIDAFYANQLKLQAQGAEGIKEAQRQREIYVTTAKKFGNDIGDAVANTFSGYVGVTEGANQLRMATAGKSYEILTDRTKTSAEAIDGLGKAVATTMPTQIALGLRGGSREFFGGLYQNAQLAFSDVAKGAEQANEASKESTDEATKAYNQMLIKQMDARNSMQDLIKDGIVPVTKRMEELARVIDTILHPSKIISGFQENISKITGTGGLPGVSGKVSGKDVVSGLMRRGFSKEEAAALAGNIDAESSFNTASVNSIGATGLMQWLGPRKQALMKLAQSKGKDWKDLEVQLDFMAQEMKNGGTEAANLKKAMEMSGGDIGKAAFLIGKLVERPSDAELASSVGRRVNTATSLYNQDYTNITAPSNGYQSAVTATPKPGDLAPPANNKNWSDYSRPADKPSKTAKEMEELNKKTDKTNALLADLLTINRNR